MILDDLERDRTVNTLLGISVLASAYIWRIEPRWVRVSRYVLDVPDLPPAFDGYRITHISDLHLSVPMNRRNLSRVIAVTNRTLPDLIVITGDFATYGSHEVKDEQSELDGLFARDGVFACWGNHDYYVGPDAIRPLLRDAGIQLLNNAHHVLRKGQDRLVLAGLDDAMWGQPDLADTLDGAPENTPVVLMAHEPGPARVYATDPRITLMLSGHTHGGQIRLPGIGPLVLPALSRPYVLGPYMVDGMALHVTSGTGTGRFVARFNCRPEIAVITLQRGAEGVQKPVWRNSTGGKLNNGLVMRSPGGPG